MGFCSIIKGIFFPWETDFQWLTLSDFTVENAKFEREICWKLIKKKRNVVYGRYDNHIMCHICAKGFLDSNFKIKHLLKIFFFFFFFFYEIAQKFT